MKVGQSLCSGGTTRRKLLKYGLYAGLAAGLSPCLWASGCRRRPSRRREQLNLLVISIDTLRADHVSCYGYDLNTTPNIDQLASQSHRFSQAYTVMPTTLPTHASLFTSLYPTQHTTRRNGQGLSAGATTLAEILQSSGYDTAAFVSTHILNAKYGLNQGFQTYNGVGDRKERPAKEPLVKTKRWLWAHRDNPYFLFMHMYDPHTFYFAPSNFRKNFKAPASSMPPKRGFQEDTRQYNRKLVREIIAAYDAEIAYSDWAVGELLEELDRLGLAQSTVVVLLSDHGETLDELIQRYEFAFDHGKFLYAHELRIPLIIHMPSCVSKVEAMVHTSPVSIIDIMPTILEILGLELPDSMMGQPLLDMLRGKSMSHGPIFSERRIFEKPLKPYLAEDDYSIIEGKWHLIHSSIRGVELYDLASDPKELKNLGLEHEKGKYLDRKLREHLDSLRALFVPSVFERDVEAIQRLRSLGYAD